MFNIHMLSAGHGDCLWVEYGDKNHPSRILIDAGTPQTYERALLPKIESTQQSVGTFAIELLVITHVDQDHIGGVLRLLDRLDKDKVKIGEIWFNGFFHLSNERPGTLGPKDGERLSELIIRGRWQWNSRFGGRAVMVPETGTLPSFDYSGMKVTLLSPSFDKLQSLKRVWKRAIQDAGLVPGAAYSQDEKVLPDGFLGNDIDQLAKAKFREDTTEANGSSIAFLCEYGGRRVLFSGDAHPSTLLEHLKRAPFDGRPQSLDAFKLPHHASKHNVSTELLEAFPSEHYLVSTNGERFKHPDMEALSRVVVVAKGRDPTLHFNYRTVFNSTWGSASRRGKWQYKARFAQTDNLGLTLEL